jgi:oligopeptide/dipeptide ABC transporter ATP-binding protein
MGDNGEGQGLMLYQTVAGEGDWLLDVRDLHTYFFLGPGQVLPAVRGVSFVVKRGHVLGIIGESGSGKSVTSRSILRVVDSPGRTVEGEVYYKGEDILKVSERKMGQIRGAQISLIFQDPTTSLDPVYTVGYQLTEAYRVHHRVSQAKAKKRAAEVLRLVGISDPEATLDKYPCQFSAGFRQRIFIAMSIICEPDMLIADEPTTTLGITVQAEILAALEDIKQKLGTAMILITHDFGVVSQFTDDIMVMYAGICAEYASKRTILLNPSHPYTVGLIRSVPLLEAHRSGRLASIPGFPPDMLNVPAGCPFAPRCDYAQDVCHEEMPPLKAVGDGHLVRCFFPVEYDVRQDLVLE